MAVYVIHYCEISHHKPVPEGVSGEWPITVLAVYATHYYDISHIYNPYLKVSVVSGR